MDEHEEKDDPESVKREVPVIVIWIAPPFNDAQEVNEESEMLRVSATVKVAAIPAPSAEERVMFSKAQLRSFVSVLVRKMSG